MIGISRLQRSGESTRGPGPVAQAFTFRAFGAGNGKF
jgi:hypothetical protein